MYFIYLILDTKIEILKDLEENKILTDSTYTTLQTKRLVNILSERKFPISDEIHYNISHQFHLHILKMIFAKITKVLNNFDMKGIYYQED